jgi:hypothetical protein
MKKKTLCCLAAIAGAMLLTATIGYSFDSFGNNVNDACTPVEPYTGDCLLCHTADDRSEHILAKDAYLVGGDTLTDFFCPPTPGCIDFDGDGFAVEGGVDCGPVDCDDTDATINPNAVDTLNNGIDENCDGSDSVNNYLLDNDSDGFAPVEGDCNDYDPAINPVATDLPNNGIDENCDGSDSADTYLLDSDGDGFAPVEGDCNDYDPAVNPVATDIPNNDVDENCDGADSVDPHLLDTDGDSYTPAGGDCNDTDPAINPGATENCNDGFDNNCNDLIDDLDPAPVGCLVCTDSDGDTFAAEGGGCGPVDCDDTDAASYPGAVDIPNNGIDENCDGVDSVDTIIIDNDGDDFTQVEGDCDDADAAINPGAADIPNNGIDENCDGTDSVDTTVIDYDGDGFTPATGDCDDTDGAINPDAAEICTDSIDNNCNGLVDTQDPNAIECPLICVDTDLDGYAIDGGDCGQVDCDDKDARVSPGEGEICDDGIDNDCDGSIEEGCDATCPDVDGDGYQDAACGGNDCNDSDAAINPGTAEVLGNGTDENCNGTSDDTCLTCEGGDGI